MDWLPRIKSEWNGAGIIERFIWIFTILYPLSDFLIRGWKMPTFDIYFVFDIFLYALLVAAIILNIRMRKDRDAWRKTSDRLQKVCENKELELLIKPLYLAFDKYPRRDDNMSSLVHILSSLTELSNNPIYRTSILKELADNAVLVVETMKQHRELAQPRLQELIDEYLEMRKNNKEISILKSYGEAEKKLNEIENLVNKRYHELTDVN